MDHILVASSDAEMLFSVLSDTLQLPVAWPMSDYGSFASGGIAVGNVNLEVFGVPMHADSVVRAQFEGFALEPESLHVTLQELKARGIAHGPSTPYNSTKSDGATTTLWTTAMLPSVSNDSMVVFLCEYTHDVIANRQRSLLELQTRDGGPLAIESVREIVYGTTEVEESWVHWQGLFDPLAPTSPGLWHPVTGPAIRVSNAQTNGIRELVLSVSSLTKARRYLSERGLLGIDRAEELMIAGPLFQGLSIRLVESER